MTTMRKMSGSLPEYGAVDNGIPDDWIPQEGRQFESETDTYDFYNQYAGLMGFEIRKEHANKNKVTSIVTLRKYVCDKEGFYGKDKRDYLTKKVEMKHGVGVCLEC